jgi:hypothetical protein
MKTIDARQSYFPLLRRTQLLPGESLVSLLERLTLLNYYRSSRILHRICHWRLKAPANEDDLTRPKWVDTFLQLADLTHISPEELYAASLHRFAPCLTLPQQSPVTIPWIGSTSKAMLTTNLSQKYLRFVLAAQYCPRCLKAAAYHRLNWTPTAAAICLEHHCLLFHRCPQCHKRISIQEIIRRHCSICQADLSAAEPISVDTDELGIQSQRLIQSCLAGENITELPGMGGLPSQHPAVLFHLLESLSRRLLICRKDWPSMPVPLDGLNIHITPTLHRVQTLTPEEYFYLLRAAFAGFANWPEGLFLFLDAYCGDYSPTQTSERRDKRLRLIRQDWFQPTWITPEFEFAQQRFVDYLLVRDPPQLRCLAKQLQNTEWFIEQTGLWSGEHAASALELSIQSMKRLALENCLWSHSKIVFPVFERSKILSLRQKWQSGWPLSDASQWLGLHPSTVRKLVDVGLLIAVNELETSSPELILDRCSVEAFFDQVARQLKPYLKGHRALISLEKTAQLLSVLGIDQVDLLWGVRLGILPAYQLKSTLPHLGCLGFVKKTAFTLCDLLFAQRGWISDRQFALEKKMSLHQVLTWIQKLSITPEVAALSHRYYDQQLLEHYWQNLAPP